MSSTSEPLRRIPRSARVFSYDAAHAPVARLAAGESILVETQNAFASGSR